MVPPQSGSGRGEESADPPQSGSGGGVNQVDPSQGGPGEEENVDPSQGDLGRLLMLWIPPRAALAGKMWIPSGR